MPAVRYHPSRRHKYIVIRGIEPLGNLCTDHTPSWLRATPGRSFESAGQTLGEWEGTWGAHHHSFAGLLLRAQCRFATFSGDWKSYDYIEYKGGTFYIPPQCTTFLFGIDPQFTKISKEGEKEQPNEETWLHPGWLLHQRGTHIIYSKDIKPWRRWYKLRVKPGPTWEGPYSLPNAFNFIMSQWWWSWLDFQHAFEDNTRSQICHADPQNFSLFCGQKPWWFDSTYKNTIEIPKRLVNKACNAWVNRQEYMIKIGQKVTDKMLHPEDDILCGNQSQQSQKKYFQQQNPGWGPFLPLLYNGDNCSLWFKYRYVFKVSGDCEYRKTPSTDLTQMVPTAPGPWNAEGDRPQIQSRSILKKSRKRPLDTADILLGDTDDGILTETGLERISGPSPKDLLCGMENTPPKRVRFRQSDVLRKHKHRILNLIDQLSR